VLATCVLAACGGGGGSGGSHAVPQASLGPTQTGSTTDWTTFGFDAQRTGENPFENRISTSNVASLHQLWSFKTAALYVTTQPVVAANVQIPSLNAFVDVVIVGDEHGNVYGINAGNGNQLWKRTLGSQSVPGCPDIPDGVYGVTGTPVVDRTHGRSRAYLVDGVGALHALDLATGTDASGWPVSIGLDPTVDHVYSGPLYDASTDRLFVSPASYCDNNTYYGRIIELNAANGTQTTTPFRTVTVNNEYGGAVWGQGTASLDPRGNGRIYTATGNAVPDEAAGYADGVLALDQASLSVAAFNQPNANGFDIDFGATPTVFTPPGCAPMLAVQQKTGILYVYKLDSINSGSVQSFDLATDHVTSVNLAGPAYSRSTNMLYAELNSSGSTTQAGMAAFAISNCSLSLAWNQPYGVGQGLPMTQVIVANGVVYAGSGKDGFLKAFAASTGAPLLSVQPTGGPIFATPTVANGRLFVATWDGHVVAYGLPGDTGSAGTRTTQGIH
jgi:outer membrane protein assembly factor BamB